MVSDKSKMVRVDELSKITNNGVLEKRIPKFGFVCYIYNSIKKINVISKFKLVTNNVTYVHIASGFYQGCPAIWNKEKVNMKSNKDESAMIILILNGLHLDVFCLENIKVYWCTGDLIKKCINFLANFGIVFVSLSFASFAPADSSLALFMVEIMEAREDVLEKHKNILKNSIMLKLFYFK